MKGPFFADERCFRKIYVPAAGHALPRFSHVSCERGGFACDCSQKYGSTSNEPGWASAVPEPLYVLQGIVALRGM